MRMTCAPPAAPDPVGASADRASLVAAGSAVAPESSTGAPMGGAISTDAAIAACQSPVGASVTTFGWVPGTTDGNTARATPAASATGSLPGTRVVFLVASAGKPSFCAAWGAFDGTLIGTPTVTVELVTSWSSLVPPPQPASVSVPASASPQARTDDR